MRLFTVVLTLAAFSMAFAQGVRIYTHAGGVDDYGAVVIGEIANESATPVEFVKVTASFYDEAGTFIDSAFAYTMIDTIPAGERAPFVLGTDSVQEFASYELHVEANPADPPTGEFTVRDARLVEDDFGWSLVGQVVNNSSEPAESVKIVASAYMAGPIAGVGFAYSTRDTIPPGEVSPFTVYFQTMLRDATDYRVWVQGRF
jgi:hypothetical protein